MKKILSIALFIFFLFIIYLKGSYVGNINFRPINNIKDDGFILSESANLRTFFAGEIAKGNLKLLRIQKDYTSSMEHYRYKQFFKGLEVFGAQIIQHYRNGKMTGINGRYFQIADIDAIPAITDDEAVEFFKYDLGKEGLLERDEKSKLIIYPVNDRDYRLAYEIVLEKGAGYSMTGIIDAKTGEVLLKYSNINYDELTIGLGIGYHGEQYKLSTTSYNGFFWLYDENKVRPVNQYTYNWNIGGYIAWDSDNYWDYDGTLINVHAFLGLTYDYYYLVHKREGIDGYNLLHIEANVHYPTLPDNACWSSMTEQIYFGDPYYRDNQIGAGLDCVAHEYSHGVTQFTSALIYHLESGALNESFSDIMGTAVEHYWQPEGNGLLQADWYIGEDTTPFFSTGIRNLANPNLNSDSYGSYPCHLLQKINLPDTEDWDWGGVHHNSTIYSHAYYLLAHGGTNPLSGITVNGIGIDKATSIFYRTWAYYLWPTSEFIDAATYLPYSAYEFYGLNSNEYAQTIRAMEAIGWIYGSQQEEISRYRNRENSRFFKKNDQNIKDIIKKNPRESDRLKISSRVKENALPQIKSDEAFETMDRQAKKANKKEKK
jgi:bacillolysin